MHILVAAKQVLDPDGINSYALWGRLEVSEDGRGFNTGETVPRIINAYDEQAMEAALQIAETREDVRITAVTVGSDTAPDVLKRCYAMGAENTIHVHDEDSRPGDPFRVSQILASVAEDLGDVDLILCGRQGSDYDQGAVPAILSEDLGLPFITMAAKVKLDEATGSLHVEVVTPDGPETLECDLPAVVAVSNEIGQPRYPSSRRMIQARRNPPTVFQASELLQEPTTGKMSIKLLTVPLVQGNCEIIEGGDPKEKASQLLQILRERGAING